MFVFGAASAHLVSITITPNLIIYLIIAAIIGFIAEALVGWRLPLGIIGAIIAALVGMWLVINVIKLTIVGDPVISGVPIITSLLGAIVLVSLWHLLTVPLWRRRPRYSYRRRYRDRY